MQNFILLFIAGLSLLNSPSFAACTIKTQDGQLLSAKWSIPQGEVRGVALILQGSGNVDADGDVSSPFVGTALGGKPAKLSEEIAVSLEAQGIASLRYSKRGFDDPTQALNQKFPFLQQDAETALAILKERFPGKPVSIVGFSEGALIGALVANHVAVDGLFLMSPPMRRLDQVLGYQFISWPVDLVVRKMKARRGEFVVQDPTIEMPLADVAKVLGLDLSLKKIDADHNGVISVQNELIPAYQGFHKSIQGLLQTPNFKGWYDSYMQLPDLTQVMAGVQTKSLFIYQGMEDSQVNWSWIVEDAIHFKVLPVMRLHTGLGHCFAPFSGALKSVKASGPMEDTVLNELARDVATVQGPLLF